MTTQIPSDDELDAAVARLEPRLFMTLGARSRRLRFTRIIGGSAAGAGLVAAGLAIGVFLIPTSAVAPILSADGDRTAQPTPSATAPSAATFGTLDGALRITCHDASGSVIAKIQVRAPATDPAAACDTTTRPLSGYGADVKHQRPTITVACAGSNGSADVYVVTPGVGDVCGSHGVDRFSLTK